MAKRHGRFIALILSVLMIVSQLGVVSFAADEAVSEAAAAAVEQTQDKAATDADQAAADQSAPAAEKAAPAVKTVKKAAKKSAKAAAFDQSKTVNGVKVNVKAAKGVFPKGAKLSVKKVKVPAAVDTENAEEAYAFDISILAGGKKIQPDGKAKVSFTTAEVAEKSLETAVYHMDGKTPEELKVTESGETATVTTTGFSVFTVTFTTNSYYAQEFSCEMVLEESTPVVDLINDIYYDDVKFDDDDINSVTIYEDSPNTRAVEVLTFNSRYVLRAREEGIAKIHVAIPDPDFADLDIVVEVSEHKHEWGYTKTGDPSTVSVFCNNKDCDYYQNHGIEVSLSTEGTIPYDTTKHSVTLEPKQKDLPSGLRYGKAFFYDENGNRVSSGSITSAGVYTVKVAVFKAYNEPEMIPENKLVTLKSSLEITPIDMHPTISIGGNGWIEGFYDSDDNAVIYENYPEDATDFSADIGFRKSGSSHQNDELKPWNEVSEAKAGSYTAIAKMSASNYNNATAECNFEITKNNVTPPTAIKDLVESDGKQALVEPGKTDMGYMQYMLTQATATQPDPSRQWTNDVSKAKLGGNYNVWYRVVKDSSAVASSAAVVYTSDTPVAVHVHKWNYGGYNVNVGKRTVTCDYCNAEFDLSIKVNDKIYDGNPAEVTTAVGEGAPKGMFSFSNIRYMDSADTSLKKAPVDVGSYSAETTFKCYGKNIGTVRKTYKINQADPVEVAPELEENLVYNGEPQKLIKDSTGLLTKLANSDGVKLEYRVLPVVDDVVDENNPIAEWNSSAPELTSAGTYMVRYRVNSNQGKIVNKNYVQTTKTDLGKVTISKAATSISVTPAKNLVYNGSEQDLLTGFVVEPEEAREYARFSFSSDGADWSSDGLSAKEPGTYTVYYKVEESDNYKGTEVASKPVSISKAKIIVSAPKVKKNLVYDGTDQVLLDEGGSAKANGFADDMFKLQYSSDGKTWSDGIESVTGKDAKTYEVQYRVVTKLGYVPKDTRFDYVNGKGKGKIIGIPGTVEATISPKPLAYVWKNESDAIINNDRTYRYDYTGTEHFVKVEVAGMIEGETATVNTTDASVLSAKDHKSGGNYLAETNGVTFNSGAVSTNYKLPDNSSKRYWNIDRIDLTITAKDITLTYGDELPSSGVEVTYEGLLNCDNAGTAEEQIPSDGVITGELSATYGDYEPGSDVGKYTIHIVKSLNSTNYNIKRVDGTLTVNPKPVTIEWNTDGHAKCVENGADHYVTASVVEPFGSDAVIPVYDGVHVAKKAGDYTAKVVGLQLSFEDADTDPIPASNYVMVDEEGKEITESTHNWSIAAPAPTPGGGSVSDPVADLVKMIEALDPNAATYADDAQKVVDAYNALTADQKADQRLKDKTVADKLAAAQEEAKSEEQKKADQKAADEASALITKLPDDPSKASYDDAMAAYKAYMALTDAQKALLSPAAQKKVAEYAYYYERQAAEAKKITKFKVKNVKTRKAKATWKKTAGISGYQLTYKAKGTKTKKVTLKASAVKKVVKKLKKGKKYTFRIRTFTKVYNPYTGSYVNVYGSWAKKTVKIKK